MKRAEAAPGSMGVAWMQDVERLADALGLSSREARAEAELLLIRALGIGKARLLARPELLVECQRHSRYREYIERRVSGEPIAYILGTREFFGLELDVTPAVLIPRPETELLVELALARIPERAARLVLDLGTGSGCIALAVAHSRPAALVVATDISEMALEVARGNAQRHDVRNVQFLHGANFEPVRGLQFDLIISNPPYVADGDPHLTRGDLRFEPRSALAGGPDGLGVLGTLIAQAPPHLRAGWLLLEHGSDQSSAVRQLLDVHGFTEVFTQPDLAGLPRASGAQLARLVAEG